MLKITVLGCGSSVGVPSLKYQWGECDNGNPKNRRTRSSILVEKSTTSLLVDMSPDLRQQLLDYGVRNHGAYTVDAAFITHVHYDHIFGINELRPLFFGEDRMLPLYAQQNVIDDIKKSFAYLFEDNQRDIYKPYISLQSVENNTFTVGDITGICFEQDHGYTKSTGIRINSFAYSTDVVGLDDNALAQLHGLDVWIVDCLGLKKKPTHANLEQVLEWVDLLKPKKTFLTHMSISMDYDTLMRRLPERVQPAYDQMEIIVD